MEEGRQYRMNLEVFQAASTGDSSFFENLADSSSSTFLQVTIGKNTVLHVALQFKKIDAAKNIVNLSPKLVYETNSKGNTPLHVAASVGDSSMVRLLIEQAKKLDLETGGRQQLLSMVNQDGNTALHVAVRYGNFEVVKELINENDPAELTKQVNKVGESALFLAVDKQHYEMASHILSNAPDCSYAGRDGMNILHALVIHTSTYSKKDDLLLQSNMKKYGRAGPTGRARLSRGFPPFLLILLLVGMMLAPLCFGAAAFDVLVPFWVLVLVIVMLFGVRYEILLLTIIMVAPIFFGVGSWVLGPFWVLLMLFWVCYEKLMRFWKYPVKGDDERGTIQEGK